jgi:hypothetical protein
MVARYVPSLVVIGIALAAYRLLGIDELFEQLIKPKTLQESYDYIIGEPQKSIICHQFYGFNLENRTILKNNSLETFNKSACLNQSHSIT